jgi:TRAP transporter TAXI family solute receptor
VNHFNKEKNMKQRILTAMAVVLLGMAFTTVPALAGSSAGLKPITMTWVAGGVGGGWYVQAGGIAELIAKKEPKIIIKVIPGGGVANPVRVSRHTADLGWGITFVDKMAFKGLKPVYKESNPNIRSLGGIFGIYHVHFLAAKDQGIHTVGELADMIKSGKALRVAAPMKGTSDLPLINNILAVYGVSLDDVEKNGGKVFHASYSDMVDLYQDHHVNFVFTHLALPGSAITQMCISRDSILLSVSDACINDLHNKLGTLALDSEKCVIPAKTYKGQEADVPAVASAGELLINKDVPDVVAYTIIKTICDNVKELYLITPANRTFDPKLGWKNVAVPLHPGAEKYYKEAGYMP